MDHNNTIKITKNDCGIRLDRFFKRHYPTLAFGMVAKLIRTKKITLNGLKSSISSHIKEGDILRFPKIQDSITKKPSSNKNPPTALVQTIKSSIIFEDENIIAINKPAGIAVQGGSNISNSIDSIFSFLYDERPKLVHRIDKETSGVLILAKNSNIASKLGAVIKSKNFDKTYLAICYGNTPDAEGSINSPIAHHNQIDDNKEVVMRPALTHYRVLDKALNSYCLLELQIPTGRNHQIRIHLASINCPVLGDKKYGKKSNANDLQDSLSQKMHLHSMKISFQLLGKSYNIEAIPPSHFLDACNELRLEIK